MATLRKITLNWEIRTGAITCDTGYIKRQEKCDVDLYVTVDGDAYALDTGWALNLSVKPTLLGDNDALIAITSWTASATTGLYQATAQTMGSTDLDTYLAANNADTTDDDGNKIVDLDVYYTVSSEMQSKSDTVTLICKPDVGRTDDDVPAPVQSRNDFLVSNGTGLLANVATGILSTGASIAAQTSIALTNNATNYVQLNSSGVASANTSAYTDGYYPLALIVTSGGAITSNTDRRPWIDLKGGGGGAPAGNSGDIQTNNAGAFGALTPGTGVATALATSVNSAGAFVIKDGALGTPSSGALDNCSIPISGVSGMGFGALTGLQADTNTAGGFAKIYAATTVSGLGAASSFGAGFRKFVTDATATTFLSVVAGGGANNVPVVSDGTNWLIG